QRNAFALVANTDPSFFPSQSPVMATFDITNNLGGLLNLIVPSFFQGQTRVGVTGTNGSFTVAGWAFVSGNQLVMNGIMNVVQQWPFGQTNYNPAVLNGDFTWTISAATSDGSTV